MSAKVDYVTAQFGTTKKKFHIDRDDLGIFEVAIKSSAFVMYQKFLNGAWSADEVSKILKFASLSKDEREQMTRIWNMGGGVMPHLLDGSSARSVDAILKRDGPGNHAVLAMRAVEAALFGLSLEDAVVSTTEAA